MKSYILGKMVISTCDPTGNFIKLGLTKSYNSFGEFDEKLENYKNSNQVTVLYRVCLVYSYNRTPVHAFPIVRKKDGFGMSILHTISCISAKIPQPTRCHKSVCTVLFQRIWNVTFVNWRLYSTLISIVY